MEHQFFIRQQKLYRSLVAAAASEAAAAKADARQEKCAGGKSQRGLWLGDQRLRCLRLGQTKFLSATSSVTG